MTAVSFIIASHLKTRELVNLKMTNNAPAEKKIFLLLIVAFYRLQETKVQVPG